MAEVRRGACMRLSAASDPSMGRVPSRTEVGLPGRPLAGPTRAATSGVFLPALGSRSEPPKHRVPDLTALRQAVAERSNDELARLGAKVPRAEFAVVLAAFVVGALAVAWTFSRHLALTITDAQAHLVIARRIIDGPNAGLGQVGTVWLPFPHLLLSLFTLPIGWWRSGLGAALLGVLCLGVTCLATYRTAVRCTGSTLAGFVAVVVILSAPTMLFIHTTAMTEPVLLAAVSATLAAVTGWETKGWSYSGGEIVAFCGAGAFLVTLSRYEGWAFVAVAGLYCGVSIGRRSGFRRGFRALVFFAIAPAIAGVLWLAFNAIYFGDPLAFQRGEGSAAAQMTARRLLGALPDYHRFGHAVSTYGWVVQATCGRVLCVSVIAATALYAAGVGPRLRSKAPFALLSMGVFHVLSLWAGQTYISREYAVRYGLVLLPFGALVVGWAASAAADLARRIAARSPAVAHFSPQGMAVAVVAGVSGLLAVTQMVTAPATAILREGAIDQSITAPIDAAARWTNRHRTVGSVLIDDSANPSVLSLGLPLGDVVASFSGPTWKRATRGRPDLVAEWAVIDRSKGNDRVASLLQHHPAGWRRVYRNGPAEVYRFEPSVRMDDRTAADAPLADSIR